MFLIQHFIALHRKLIVRLAIATCITGVILQTLFVYLGQGLMNIMIATFPFMTLAFFVYVISFMWHFTPNKIDRARKVAIKAKKQQRA